MAEYENLIDMFDPRDESEKLYSMKVIQDRDPGDEDEERIPFTEATDEEINRSFDAYR